MATLFVQAHCLAPALVLVSCKDGPERRIGGVPAPHLEADVKTVRRRGLHAPDIAVGGVSLVPVPGLGAFCRMREEPNGGPFYFFACEGIAAFVPLCADGGMRAFARPVPVEVSLLISVFPAPETEQLHFLRQPHRMCAFICADLADGGQVVLRLEFFLSPSARDAILAEILPVGAGVTQADADEAFAELAGATFYSLETFIEAMRRPGGGEHRASAAVVASTLARDAVPTKVACGADAACDGMIVLCPSCLNANACDNHVKVCTDCGAQGCLGPSFHLACLLPCSACDGFLCADCAGTKEPKLRCLKCLRPAKKTRGDALLK